MAAPLGEHRWRDIHFDDEVTLLREPLEATVAARSQSAYRTCSFSLSVKRTFNAGQSSSAYQHIPVADTFILVTSQSMGSKRIPLVGAERHRSIRLEQVEFKRVVYLHKRDMQAAKVALCIRKGLLELQRRHN